MNSLIDKIQILLFRYRKSSLFLCLVIGAFLVYFASSLKLEEDIMDLLPLEEESVRSYSEVLKNFQKSNHLVFMVQMTGADTNEATLINSVDELANQLRNSSWVERVFARWDAGDMMDALNVLRTFRADLFTAEDEALLTNLLTPEAIDNRLAGWKRLLIETPSPFLSQLFKTDPLGIDTFLTNKLERARTKNSDMVISNGYLFSADNRSIILTAKPVIKDTDSNKGMLLVNDINRIIADIKTINPDINIAWLSGHRFAVHNASTIKRDITVTVSISLTAITLLCLLIFKRKHYFVMALIPAFFGILAASAVTALTLPGISAIVLGMGGVLIGIVVDFGIHVLFRADQLKKSELTQYNILKMVSGIRTPLLLCAVTTLSAFLILSASSFPGYSQLGKFSVIGIIVSVLFVLFILPLLISQKDNKNTAVLNLTALMDIFQKTTQKSRTSLMVFSLGLTLIALPGLFKIEFDGDVEKLNMVSPSIEQDMNTLRSTFPSLMNSAYIIARANDQETLFQRGEQIENWLAAHKDSAGIQSYTSLAGILPSGKIRLANRNRWEHFWNSHKKTSLITDLTEIVTKHGLRSSFLTSQIEKLPGTMPDLDLTKILTQPLLEQMISSQLSTGRHHSTLLIRFSLSNMSEINNFGSKLKEDVPFAFAASGKSFVSKILELILSEFVKLGSLALFSTILLLSIYTGNLFRTIRFFLPLAQAIIFTFGFMGWFNIPLNLMAVLVIIFVFGLVVDYSLFLGHASFRSQNEVSHAGSAVTVSALTTLFGIGALLFARHPALHNIGFTALLGIGSGFLFVMINYAWVWSRDKT
ncbi:MAG: MMPL family transporter [Desulfobacterales bacterium]|nr:MMPL family transporter [Desulfobacterales bacterium]